MSSAISRTRLLTTFIHQVIFGRRHLLVTNTLISATMGAVGDSIVQNAELIAKSSDDDAGSRYNFKRTTHLTMAGLTTGVTTHYWYIILDRFFGSKRTALNLLRKIALDQILFSPVNLLVYFTTLGVCERSSWRTISRELVEKGLADIYIAEWIIWPPVQLINFALMPLRYRILFDNAISLGFDIYSPYVKYEKEK